MIASEQNVKRLPEFGCRNRGRLRTPRRCTRSKRLRYMRRHRATRCNESSSVTDHRRLMQVAILAQLSEHESRDVLPGYSCGSVSIPAEKDPVLTRGRFVGEPGRAYDHPLQTASSDYLLLTVFVLVLVTHYEGQDDPVVEETAVPLAVASPDAGEANQPAYAVLLHRVDEVCSTGREKSRGLPAARPQSREHGVLSLHGSLDRLRIQRVPLQYARTVVSGCDGSGVASQGRHFVAHFQRLVQQDPPRAPRRADDQNVHFSCLYSCHYSSRGLLVSNVRVHSTLGETSSFALLGSVGRSRANISSRWSVL